MRAAVIIPFFQRSRGILTRAVQSVLRQRDVPPAILIIVDDSSPVRAMDEVAMLSPAERDRIVVLQQPNGGPGSARNRGLGAVPEGTDLVAFLDSDDEWLDDHLTRATAALGLGFDFYFSNHFDIGDSVDAFTRRHSLFDERYHALPGLDDIFAFHGDLVLKILDQCPVETSTVVMRTGAVRNLRFRAEFRDAYEDLVFWLDLARHTKRIAFSTRPEVRYGEGINIYRSTVSGTEASLKQIVAATRFRAYARASGSLDARQRAAVRRRLGISRGHFVAEILHRLRNGASLPWGPIRDQIRADPLTALLFVPQALRHVLSRTLDRGNEPADEGR